MILERLSKRGGGQECQWKRQAVVELFEGKQQEITRQELVERVSEHVNRILRRNLYELKLDERQTFRLLRQKEELRRY